MSSHTFIYPEILTLDNQQGFSDEFLAALNSENVFEGMLNILEMKTYGVWAFPCLKKDFCTKLIQDLEAAERNPALRITRPNSMNRYGIIMKGKIFLYNILYNYLFNSTLFLDLGFGPLISVMLEHCITILSQIIFGVTDIPHYHAFTVR
jgi:hypothetical protein